MFLHANPSGGSRNSLFPSLAAASDGCGFIRAAPAGGTEHRCIFNTNTKYFAWSVAVGHGGGRAGESGATVAPTAAHPARAPRPSAAKRRGGFRGAVEQRRQRRPALSGRGGVVGGTVRNHPAVRRTGSLCHNMEGRPAPGVGNRSGGGLDSVSRPLFLPTMTSAPPDLFTALDGPVGILMSATAHERCRPRLDQLVGPAGWRWVDTAGAADGAPVQVAYFTRDFLLAGRDTTKAFFTTVEALQGLRWLQIFPAGSEPPVYARLRGKGVRVTTGSGASAGAVALTAFTGLLMLARGFPRWTAGQRERAWLPPAPTPPQDLRGASCLIVGTGPIGQETARLCQAVGLRTTGVRRAADAVAPFDRTIAYEHLDQALPHSRFVVLACPLTELTRGLLGAARLRMLPAGAFLVNVARGEVVDEQALVAALQDRHLGGAYLDVFAREPLPADSPLWQLPGVILSPHAAAESAGAEQAVDEVFLAHLARVSPSRSSPP
ncbi:hypothetical protein GN316_18810 [Xylophilus sp. Kf1]|nr:hypothetical protein [Xylophilus sp. Kf1]